MKIIIIIGCLLLPYYAYTQEKGIDICSDSSCLYFYRSGKIPLPEWVSACKKIKEVHLSKQSTDLYDIMEQLSLINSVERIVIQNAGLKSLPYNFYKIKNLRYLDLRGNQLGTLPYSIRYCDSLSSINLDDNKMSYYGLVDIFRNTLKLNWLSLNNNQLDSLPDEICEVKNLSFLYLYYNKIQGLPECIYSIKSLKEFGIYNGRVADSPSPTPNPIDVSEVKEKFFKNEIKVKVE